MRINSCCCWHLTAGTTLLLIWEIIMVVISFIRLGVSEKKLSNDSEPVIVIYTSIRLGAAILGLYGVYQKNSIFLKPFLFMSIITLIPSATVWTLWLHKKFDLIKWCQDDPYPYPASLIVSSTVIVLSVYFIIVIRSYILQLKDEADAKKSADQNTPL